LNLVISTTRTIIKTSVHNQELPKKLFILQISQIKLSS